MAEEGDEAAAAAAALTDDDDVLYSLMRSEGEDDEDDDDGRGDEDNDDQAEDMLDCDEDDDDDDERDDEDPDDEDELEDSDVDMTGRQAADHPYLGELEDAVSFSPILEGDRFDALPIISIDVVLFPGETLPLRMHRSERQFPLALSLLEASQRGEKSIFGILLSNEHKIGTIAEVVNFYNDQRTDTIFLKSRGVFRFQVHKLRYNYAYQAAEADVVILSHCLQGGKDALTKMMTHVYPRTTITLRRSAAESSFSLESRRRLSTSSRCNLPILSSSWGFHHSRFIYERFNCQSLAAKLKSLIMTEKKGPDDPIGLSYFCAMNLALDSTTRQELLTIDTAVERLWREIQLLERSASFVLCCCRCGNRLCDKRDVFSVPGAEGTVGQYVNRNGDIHQTVTSRKAQGYRLTGLPCKEDSWFPGYMWTIMVCESCNVHLGWRFTSCRPPRQQHYSRGHSASSTHQLLRRSSSSSSSHSSTTFRSDDDDGGGSGGGGGGVGGGGGGADGAGGAGGGANGGGGGGDGVGGAGGGGEPMLQEFWGFRGGQIVERSAEEQRQVQEQHQRMQSNEMHQRLRALSRHPHLQVVLTQMGLMPPDDVDEEDVDG